MIVAAAEAAGCTRILSEDLPDETSYFGLRSLRGSLGQAS